MSISSIQPIHSFSYDNTLINVFHANINEGLPQHEHIYTHATCCHAGSIIIRKSEHSLVMTKNTQPINLAANEWHEIEALEDNTVFVNVFSKSKS